ncbi:MAG: outer membrane protein assembly factor BamA [Simkania sp.]|nr:outer membrane protein assembly factor BamA [Simkania sp.]
MNKRLAQLLSVVLFTATPAFSLQAALAPAEAFEEKRIASIEIEPKNLPPGSTFDQRAVLTKMDTKIGDPFSQTAFDHDLKMLASEYDRVEPHIEVQNGEIYLTIKVWPRPKIRAIHWIGNLSVTSKTLNGELGIKPGSTFKRQSFNKAFNKIKEYYIKKGYFESQLEYRLERDPKTNEVDVEIEVHEGRPGIIDEIQFEGFTKEEKSELLEMIYTKKYNLFTSWLTGHGRFNEEAIEQDKLTIVDFLQNRGFADAKVSLRIDDAPSSDKIIVVLTADRGPLYHFGQVTFSGNRLFSNEEIESSLLIHTGNTYSPEKLRDTAQAIKDLYGRKGYIDTVVDHEAQLVENEPIYNIHFSIEEGNPYKIGIIRVYGNTQTQTSVILRESLLIPGETFDSAKLKATQTKLEGIGYFKNVNVYAVRTQDDDSLGESYRDVFIEVEETTTGSVSAFAGFSSADDVFGGLELSETNFNYAGIPKMFSEGLSALRGGGEYLQLRANIGAKQSSYSLSWMTPYFRDTLWRVGFDLSRTFSHVVSNDIHISTFGGSIFANYPVTNLWTFGTRYRLRNSHNKLTGGNDGLPPYQRRQIYRDGIISALNVSMNYDSTDSITKPHRGFRSYIEGEYAGVFGDFYFAKASYLNTYYTLLWPRGILKYRFDFRFIEPLFKTSTPGGVPLSERFYLGGEGSVRGYRPFDLGQHFDNGDPMGGISSSVLSIEYLHEIMKLLDGFLFFDAGSLSLDRFRLGIYRLSWGFGARLDLMNRAPVTLGIGFPINPGGRGEVQKFYFSMGGQF